MYLTEVKLPESIRRIEKWVFHGCARLQVLEIRMIRNTSVSGSSTRLQGSAATGDPKWLRTAGVRIYRGVHRIRKRMYMEKGRSRNEVSDEFYYITG